MKTWTLCSVSMVGLALTLSGCAADTGEDSGTSDDELVLDNGAGAGPELFGEDPCENPAAFAKSHGYHFIQAKPGVTTNGSDGKDLIVGTGGDDLIHAGGGDDIVCAGYGEDRVYGGDGNDYLDGGGDNDHILGEAGNDLIHGRGGSDYIYGGAGDDLLFGDILDDHMWGDAGDDLLIGGHGTDVMFGGDGNDFLRGDTGNDAFIGGAGKDVASFSTAMPPGQADLVGQAKAPPSGVKIDFKNKCAAAGDVGNGSVAHDGCANGDGGNEPLDGIEVVIGSPYDDVFVSDAQKVTYIPGFGNDTCDGAACGSGNPAGDDKVLVALDDTARDTGLLVRGSVDADNLEIIRDKSGFRVQSPNGTPLVAGPNCHADGGAVVCGTKHVLRWIAAYMNDGNDVLKLAEAAGKTKAFPNDMTAHASGGDGDDFLHGGDEQDVLFTGPTGKDHLFGNKGGDALLSESRKWAKKQCTAAEAKTDPRCDEDKPDGAHYTDGADELSAGPGDDQLVADYPCGGHHYSGGGGEDIAGFARSGRFNLRAQLAGTSSKPQPFQAHAYNPQLCELTHATVMEDDLEILEASDGNDELWGNDKPNTIWGREGDDHIHGLGGDDTLEGLVGDDWLYGGAGNDKLIGAAGNNLLFQDAD